MIEFVAFFVLPFGEDMPRKETDEAISKAKELCSVLEKRCMEEYENRTPRRHPNLDRDVWAQSRIDFQTRVIGVSLRLPIEKAAEKDVVKAVRFDDFMYWDLNELSKEMMSMRDAVNVVAEENHTTVHTAFSDVRYRY